MRLCYDTHKDCLIGKVIEQFFAFGACAGEVSGSPHRFRRLPGWHGSAEFNAPHILLRNLPSACGGAPMSSPVVCTSCGKKLKVPDSLTATKVRCPGCGEIVSLARSPITTKLPQTRTKEEQEPRLQTDAEGIRKDPPSDAKPRSRPDVNRNKGDEPDEEEPRTAQEKA